MRVSLNQECTLLVSFEIGASYIIQICPILTSFARTLDVEQVRDTARRAYEHLTGLRAPKRFAVELKCVAKDEKLELVPVRIVRFDESNQLLAKAPEKINTMYRYLK
jgi:hypothetical protein